LELCGEGSASRLNGAVIAGWRCPGHPRISCLFHRRRTRTIIWQNFFGTVGVVLAAFGFLNPLLAAVIHVGSELAFRLNSARLLPIGEKSATSGRS